MRIDEFDAPTLMTEDMVEESVLEETFLSSIEHFLKGQATSGVHAVHDTVGAAEVIYKVVRSHQHLVSVVHEIREEIIHSLDTVAKLPVISKIGNTFHRFGEYLRNLITGGYGIRDFLLSLGLVTMVNMLKKATVSAVASEVKDYMLLLATKASKLAASLVATLELAGFFAIIANLELADDLLLDTLNNINLKVSSPEYKHFDPTQTGASHQALDEVEHIHLENFVSSVKNFLSAQALSGVLAVRDFGGAAHVIYKIIKDPKVLISVVHELRHEIVRTMKKISALPKIRKLGISNTAMSFYMFSQYVLKLVSHGAYGIKDFLKSLVLCSIVNGTFKLALNSGTDVIKDHIVEMAAKVSMIAEHIYELLDITGFFALWSALKIGNDLLFETLSEINKRISEEGYQFFTRGSKKLKPTNLKLWRNVIHAIQRQQPDVNIMGRAQEIADRYKSMGGQWA